MIIKIKGSVSGDALPFHWFYGENSNFPGYPLGERGVKKMEYSKIMRYALQLSMLKRLNQKKLINEEEYNLIKEGLMKDYGVITSITVDCTNT